MTKKGRTQKAYPRVLGKILLFLSLSIGSFGLLLLAYFLAPPPSVIGADQARIVRDVSSNGFFEVRFDAFMNTKSVENAVSFSPDVAGSFDWKTADHFRVFA
jgi:hypothetical protein